MLQVFRQIYTGPRSALDPGATRKGRLSKAHLHNLTEVLPRNIAYTCVIVSCIFSLISFDVDLNYRPALPCAAQVGPSTTVLSSTASSIKIQSGCLRRTRMTHGSKKPLSGGTSKSFFRLPTLNIYMFCIKTGSWPPSCSCWSFQKAEEE